MDVVDTPLSARLKSETHASHDRLDRSIMDAATFTTMDGYRRFLRIQCAFHGEIDTLYIDPALQALLPGLVERRRLPLIQADLADLREVEDAPDVSIRSIADPATALGWLYVAEGSNLGAASLRKEAARLGLSDTHGARHLAPAEDGPAAHWRQFKVGLDACPLTDAEAARAIAGANAAFARVQALVDAEFG